MKIHIVDPYHSAAMQRMIYPLLNELPKLYTVTTGQEVDSEADVNIHCPWHTMIGLESRGKHIIMYTHCNPPDAPKLMDACDRADLVVCMSFTGRDELLQMGADPAKLWVNYSASEDFKFKRKIIGVVGYPQPNGRKRESLLLDLAWQYDLTPFQFVLVGDGWDELAGKLQSLGVKVDMVRTNDNMMQEVYQQIDCLLVTGYVEGGSLPILEAMAVGTPVLSPKFGYASDLLDRHYETPAELMDWLNEIAENSIFTHQLVRSWTWSDYAREYALIIGRLLGESVNLHPEFAMSRYAQLLDIIDDIKPNGIVEIGTWNGNNAIRMIQQAAKHIPIQEIYYQGFDLFEAQTGEQFRRELSKQGYPVSVVNKRLDATGASIELVEGNTRETIEELAQADLYFVDGGHSERTIENDGKLVLDILAADAVAVFDDYYHEGKPAGVGCNKFIDALDAGEFKVEHLPVRTIADDGRMIGMVKVRRYAKLYLRMRETTSAGSNSRYFTEPDGSVSAMLNEDAQSPTGC